MGEKKTLTEIAFDAFETIKIEETGQWAVYMIDANGDPIFADASCASLSIAEKLRRKASDHLLAILSTVDAEATERAAMVCDTDAKHYTDLLAKGKGEWPSKTYVKDHTWNHWIARETGALSLAHAIRSTLPTPAARAGEDEKENTKT